MADDLTVSAAEANRSFSKLLRLVKAGNCVTVTSHGEPVAKIAPIGEDERRAEVERRREAHRRLVEHFNSVEPVVVGPWTREELYERD